MSDFFGTFFRKVLYSVIKKLLFWAKYSFEQNTFLVLKKGHFWVTILKKVFFTTSLRRALFKILNKVLFWCKYFFEQSKSSFLRLFGQRNLNGHPLLTLFINKHTVWAPSNFHFALFINVFLTLLICFTLIASQWTNFAIL